jgi:archaellum component FlaC
MTEPPATASTFLLYQHTSFQPFFNPTRQVSVSAAHKFMKYQIWITLSSFFSIAALIVAVWSHHEIQTNTRATVESDSSAKLEQMHELDAKLTTIISRLDSLEKQPASSAAATNSSLAEVDANIEALAKSASKNSQDVQKVSQQVQMLTRQIQDALNGVATQIIAIRSELRKQSEHAGTK